MAKNLQEKSKFKRRADSEADDIIETLATKINDLSKIPANFNVLWDMNCLLPFSNLTNMDSSGDRFVNGI